MKIKPSVSKLGQQSEKLNMKFYQYAFLILMFPKRKSWNLKAAILKWGNKVMLPGKFRIRKTFNFSFNSMYAFGQSPLSYINGGGERRWNLNQNSLIARMCLLKRKFLGKETASTEQCPWNVIIFHILWYQIVKYNKTEERKTKMRVEEL